MMPSPDLFPVPLIHIDETDSTNCYLQSLCSDAQMPEEFTTVVADYQNSGKGQRGNSWESAPRANLLFSTVLYPGFLEAKQQFLLSQIISLAIKEELSTYAPDLSIKWPNDIYYRNKKICGILIENNLMGRHICRSIAGIGININQEAFTSNAPNPVSLFGITGKRYDTFKILAQLMVRLRNYYGLLRNNDIEIITSRYRNSLFRREGLHRYRDCTGEFLAAIDSVEPDGKLILEDNLYRKRGYLFKEVEYLLSEDSF